MSSVRKRTRGQSRRMGAMVQALLLGLPLTAGVLALFHLGPLRNSPLFRYVEYPIQWVEVGFFCCGLAVLLAKFVAARREAAACELEILPRWDGKPVAVEKANELMASIERQPVRIQRTWIGQRLRAGVEFLRLRRSAAEFDEHLRTLADNDAMAQDSGFAFTRFITWAIPILGFLGTVIGITGAIAGVTPEVLEESLSAVTDGLAEAFDSTALALALTMVLMFLSYLVDRQEQAVLATVDALVEEELAHRFLRESADAGPFLEIVRQSTQALAASVEGLVTKQAEVWAAALGEPERRAALFYQQAQQQLTQALGQALDETANAYQQRLYALEQHTLQQSGQLLQQMASLAAVIQETGREQQQALQQVAEGVCRQAALLTKLQEDATNLVHLQAVLHQNLAALASTNAFEEAVHSLTAAVHLLTARANGTGATPRLFQGKAA